MQLLPLGQLLLVIHLDIAIEVVGVDRIDVSGEAEDLGHLLGGLCVFVLGLFFLFRHAVAELFLIIT